MTLERGAVILVDLESGGSTALDRQEADSPPLRLCVALRTAGDCVGAVPVSWAGC